MNGGGKEEEELEEEEEELEEEQEEGDLPVLIRPHTLDTDWQLCVAAFHHDDREY